MNKDRNIRTLAIVAVLLSITGISVAFAALAQTLNIGGQAKLAGSEWKVEFDPETLSKNVEKQAKELSDPVLTGTNFTYNISLKTPGDSVTYTFDVKNMGTIDAKVDSAPVLVGIPEEYEDDILYTITYLNGENIKVNDPLNEDESRTLKLVLYFKDTATTVPSEEVSMTLSASIVYVQQ